MTVAVHLGDSRAVLATLADCSVDSIVTDPPYELGFMGAGWDASGIAYDVGLWREVLRVLKPGGHVASFGGTRTYHRMAVAIEDAGFEIRDQLAWAYGSGFPKSLDVSKAIDKARSEDAEPIRRVCRFIRAGMDGKRLKSRHLIGLFDDCNPRLIDHWAARDSDSQPALPTLAQWLILKGALNLSDEMDAEFNRLDQRKGLPSDVYRDAEVVGSHSGALPGLVGKRFDGDKTIRERSDDARQWQGWGTALKPAWEPICLARKPLSESTVAANVLRWGTGALNVDSCRVEATVGDYAHPGNPEKRPIRKAWGLDGVKVTQAAPHSLGRWPANLCHDGSDEVAAGFPSVHGAGSARDASGGTHGGGVGTVGFTHGAPAMRFGDEGSAARFFYSAKAGKLDRLGSTHPTVKPVDLMRWLVRLITPPGGTALDPFAGSGTTGIAALAEGFDAVLIELRAEAVADIQRRLAHVSGNGRRTADEIAALNTPEKQAKARGDDSPLFAGLL